MSIISTILHSSTFQNLFSYSVWFLIIATPLVTIATCLYCAAKGTGSVAGFIIDKSAKRVRSYQQQQRKQDKVDPPIGA